MTILDQIDRATSGLCPCGTEPADGSAYCSDDCRPTHHGPDSYNTEMRWRPDMVTAADDTDLIPLGTQTWYTGPRHATIFEHRSRPDLWHLRLDDGHRYVGGDLEVPGDVTADTLHAVAKLWRLLEQALGNTEHLISDRYSCADALRARQTLRPTALALRARCFVREDDSETEIVFRDGRGGDNLREQICAWLEANSLDPGEIPARTSIRIRDGQITVRYVFRDATGAVIPGGDGSPITNTWTVPLLQAPAYQTWDEVYVPTAASSCRSANLRPRTAVVRGQQWDATPDDVLTDPAEILARTGVRLVVRDDLPDGVEAFVLTVPDPEDPNPVSTLENRAVVIRSQP